MSFKIDIGHEKCASVYSQKGWSLLFSSCKFADDWFATNIKGEKENIAIESDVFMQIYFIWTVIIADKAPQGAMTDVTLWL